MAYILSYDRLLSYLYGGFRNGNWRRLSVDDKAMYRAGLEFAKVNREVRNPMIVARLLAIVEKIKARVKTMLLKVGLDKTEEMFSEYAKRGIFSWCPQLKAWLRSQAYIVWLGSLQISLKSFV